jgi:hypothetical protein
VSESDVFRADAVWLQAENPGFPGHAGVGRADLEVGRHYAQHPHAVTMGGPESPSGFGE